MNEHLSWGRYPTAADQTILPPTKGTDPLPKTTGSLLPRGLGRSYGDVCLNEGGALMPTTGMDQILAFDARNGVVRAEAGVSLQHILERIVPEGWFLPVTPGTSRVTLGGALANDVHGKNHHCDGTFGCHVLRFELLRSDGARTICSPTENADFFRATIGGLGLTGLITWVELRLKRISSPYIEQDTLPFSSLTDFLKLTTESEPHFEYIVAWIDTTASGKHFGRGVFMRGNHAQEPRLAQRVVSRPLSIPWTAPQWLLNRVTMSLFNSAYFWHMKRRAGRTIVPYATFFHPLDAIEHWNRLYGKSGFLQYQFVVPTEHALQATNAILRKAQRQKLVSFLTVLKRFGDRPSPGLLSFPREGLTLAMDFPFRGQATLDGLRALDDILLRFGGRLYPAKDARMEGRDFRAMYPGWRELEAMRDPVFSSQFWRRVTK